MGPHVVQKAGYEDVVMRAVGNGTTLAHDAIYQWFGRDVPDPEGRTFGIAQREMVQFGLGREVDVHAPEVPHAGEAPRAQELRQAGLADPRGPVHHGLRVGRSVEDDAARLRLRPVRERGAEPTAPVLGRDLAPDQRLAERLQRVDEEARGEPPVRPLDDARRRREVATGPPPLGQQLRAQPIARRRRPVSASSAHARPPARMCSRTRACAGFMVTYQITLASV